MIEETNRFYIGITHAELGSDIGANFRFWVHSFRVVNGLPKHDGFKEFQIRTSILRGTAWTVTYWRDEKAFAGFVGGKLHQRAIEAGLPAIKNARFAQLWVDAAKIPLDWSELERLMDIHGRPLKLPKNANSK